MNKNFKAAGAIILLIAVIGGGFWYANKKQGTVSKEQSETVKQQEVVKEDKEKDVQEQQKVEQNKENQKNEEKVEELKVEDIDTSNWKTYRNEELGFEVKYPEVWEYDSIDGITFGDKKNCERDKIDEYWCKNHVSFDGATSGKINFNEFKYVESNDLVGVKYPVVYRESEQLDGGFFRSYVFDIGKKRNNLHYIIVEYYNNTKYKNELNIINKMLNTFKLLK